MCIKKKIMRNNASKDRVIESSNERWLKSRPLIFVGRAKKGLCRERFEEAIQLFRSDREHPHFDDQRRGSGF